MSVDRDGRPEVELMGAPGPVRVRARLERE